MRIISYIPIRSGSRGIKDKNILDMAGKPLFAWSLFFAKRISSPQDVIVSSNSIPYIEIASKFNISVEKRPDALASDNATTDSAIMYTLNRLLMNNLVSMDDYFCLLQATSPIRRELLTDKIVKLLSTNSYDSIISINRETSFEWNYAEKSFESITPTYDLNKRPMRQNILSDKKERLIENGSIYCSRISSILSTQKRVSGRIGFIECNEHEKLEVDTQDQYSLINNIMRYEIKNGNPNNFVFD